MRSQVVVAGVVVHTVQFDGVGVDLGVPSQIVDGGKDEVTVDCPLVFAFQDLSHRRGMSF